MIVWKCVGTDVRCLCGGCVMSEGVHDWCVGWKVHEFVWRSDSLVH